jgi:hypothetical protein
VVGDRLPFFAACKLSLLSKDRADYRLYVTESDLLVLKLDPPRVDQRRVMATVIGGVLGGAVGGALAGMLLGEEHQGRLNERAALLDLADEISLRQYADEGKGSFAVDPRDVSRMRIDRPSAWRRFLSGTAHEGLLRFHHRWEGEVELALLSLTDVRRAIEALPRVFGEIVEINFP